MPFYVNVLFDPKKPQDVPPLSPAWLEREMELDMEEDLPEPTEDMPKQEEPQGMEELIEALRKEVPKQLEQSGVYIRLEKRYYVEPYLVFLVVIDNTDLQEVAKFAAKRGRSLESKCLMGINSCVRFCGCDKCLNGASVPMVEAVLRSHIRKTITDQWAQRHGLKADVFIHSIEEQPAFFFNQLAVIKAPGAGSFVHGSELQVQRRRACCW